MLARPTKNITLFHQILGRVMRIAPGKEEAIVIDHSGAVAEHGMFHDDVPWSLDPNEKVKDRKEAQQKNRKEPKQLTCSQCKTVFSARRDCPSCGHQLLLPTQDIPFYMADLEEVTGSSASEKRNKKTSWEEKIEFIGGLKRHAQQKGYKDGWVNHVYKTRFGVWPNDGRLKDAAVSEPSDEVKGFIKYLVIRNAKRQQANG